jgi:hypothetical protein
MRGVRWMWRNRQSDDPLLKVFGPNLICAAFVTPRSGHYPNRDRDVRYVFSV